MAEFDIGSATVTDNTQEDFSVSPQTTDGPSEAKESVHTFDKWTQYLGYYKELPELNAVINARGTWTVGKGYKAEPEVIFLLNTIRGFGKESFNAIMKNMIRTMFINGDSFAEIIREADGTLINLKTLDPSSIRIVANRQGRIIRYEQINKTKKPDRKIQPEEMFHLCRDRVADEIHGNGIAGILANIILMKNEAMADEKRVMHRNVDPVVVIHAKTDDLAEIAKIKQDWENVKKGGETWVVPDKVIMPEIFGVAPNATLSPLAWIESLDDKFYEAAKTPKFIVGSSKGFTDAAEKTGYLAFQQSVEEDQLFIEEEILAQLNLEIEFNFPASLEAGLLSDQKKDVENGAVQPADVTQTPEEITPETI